MLAQDEQPIEYEGNAVSRTRFHGDRSPYPAKVRLHFILDSFSPHLGDDVLSWASDNKVEFAYTRTTAPGSTHRGQFKALRYFTLDATDQPDHATQAHLTRRYIAGRNYNADNAKLRKGVNTANVARRVTRYLKIAAYRISTGEFLIYAGPDGVGCGEP